MAGFKELKIPVPAGLVLVKEARPKKLKPKPSRSDREKAKRGRSARRKGHQFERDIAKLFREAGYYQACRQLEYQQGLGVDLANTGKYDIQCKRSKKAISLSAIQEVPRKANRIPVLVAKQDNMDTLVALPLKHFMELIKLEIKEITNVGN
jgi:HJR/Mrr/RecB family endonuclease